jgi:hypothetical protein
MKKIILITAAILLILAGMTSCAKDKEKENNEPLPMKGTKWKLIGYEPPGIEALMTFEPQDTCTYCYSFSFDTDMTASGLAVSNVLQVNLKLKKPVWVHTDIPDAGHERYFRDITNLVTSYTFDNNENRLYFFCDNGGCLTFKKTEQ